MISRCHGRFPPRLSFAFFALLTALVLVLSPLEAARIGMFLGTFDPPHQGMVKMLTDARHRFDLDTIFMLPVPEPVDRPSASPLAHRLAMVRLLARELPGLATLGEADLQAITSRRPDNLFEALREDIMSRGSPDDEFFQIIGEDALPKLVARGQLPAAGERRTLVVYPRRGVPVTRNRALDALEKREGLRRVPVDVPDLAGRDIRVLLRQGSSAVAESLPTAVATYIRREGLYGLTTGPLGRDVLAAFEPAGYQAKPVLLHGPTTDTVFVPAHLESLLSEAGISVADNSPDVPAALISLLEKRALQLVLFQAPTTDALDWLETQGWRTLYGYVPPPGDDRPMLFFGRQGPDWYLFVTGLFAPDRFARFAAEMRRQMRRCEIPAHRLTVLVPVASPTAD